MKFLVRFCALSGALALYSPADAAIITAYFSVGNMNCVTCPITVKKVIENVPGVIDVSVEYESHIATVTYDDGSTTAEEIAQAPTEIGYPTTPTEFD